MKKRFDDKALKLHGSGLRGFRAVCSIQVNQPLLHRWTWWNCIDCRIIYLFLLFYSHFFFSLSLEWSTKKNRSSNHCIIFSNLYYNFALSSKDYSDLIRLASFLFNKKHFNLWKWRGKKTRITYNNFSESQRILGELKASVIQSGSESANRSQP